METVDGDINTNAGELIASDSDSADGVETRRRPRWTQIWRSTAADSFDSFRDTLPSHTIQKSDPVTCTIDHLFDKNYTLAASIHVMRAQLTKCRSRRCHPSHSDDQASDDDTGSDGDCPCRYKLKVCQSSGSCEMFQHASHLADIDGSSSPVQRKLTLEMKTFIVEQLDSGVKTTAARLFAVISAMVFDNTLRGLAPKDQQVVNFVKNWCSNNPKKSMAPMIEICDEHLYDQQEVQSLVDDGSITQERDGIRTTRTRIRLGVTRMIRVGMTCLRLIRAYIAVQSRSDCTTMLHLDSTHNMVIHGYSVFAFGYSDQSCHFILLAYFCTSQKRKLDVGWCIRYIKLVCVETCGASFAPEYNMMDADKAQFNASVTELPHSTILMCWFHVAQNVWRYSARYRVSFEDASMAFEDLYDMNYATEQQFSAIKERVLVKWRGFAPGSAVRKLTDHVIKQWVATQRFAKWQAYHTPQGYAATNNPLEQYHRRLKFECPDGRQTPDELVKSLNSARLAFVNRDVRVCNYASASERLMLLYRLLCKRGCLEVEGLPSIGTVAADLYRVKQRPLLLTATERKVVKQAIKSTNARRKQLENMPEGGWAVDTRSKVCPCLYFVKNGASCLIIRACMCICLALATIVGNLFTHDEEISYPSGCLLRLCWQPLFGEEQSTNNFLDQQSALAVVLTSSSAS